MSRGFRFAIPTLRISLPPPSLPSPPVGMEDALAQIGIADIEAAGFDDQSFPFPFLPFSRAGQQNVRRRSVTTAFLAPE